MAFTPISITNGTTPVNKTWGDNAQTQYTEAINSFEQDLITAFVFSGLVATKDGSVNTQLDVTAGVAFLLQSDSTLRRRAPSSSTQTTSTPSTTYHLYLQPDGTWYWSTSNSPAANSLFIAQVTTDGSGHISTVTDERPLNTTLFNGMAGTVRLDSGAGFSGPVIVAQVLRQHVTTTGFVTPLTYTPEANGLYRISGYVEFGGSANDALDIYAQWTDPLGAQGAAFAANPTNGTDSTNLVLLNGNTTMHHPGSFPLMPMTIYAVTTGNIFCGYDNSAATPNDYVTYIIERLA